MIIGLSALALGVVLSAIGLHRLKRRFGASMACIHDGRVRVLRAPGTRPAKTRHISSFGTTSGTESRRQVSGASRVEPYARLWPRCCCVYSGGGTRPRRPHAESRGRASQKAPAMCADRPRVLIRRDRHACKWERQEEK